MREARIPFSFLHNKRISYLRWLCYTRFLERERERERGVFAARSNLGDEGARARIGG